MNTNSRIAACVVAFNPDIDLLKRSLSSYSKSVELVYIIDNSELVKIDISDFGEYSNIRYFPLDRNHGIAYALNYAAKIAIDNGFDYLLTMDQDSICPVGMVSQLLGSYEQLTPNKVGIVSPYHIYNSKIAHKDTFSLRKELSVMTSGNLINLGVFQKVGPFFTDFFIDQVDTEYCLRLQTKGYDVYAHTSILLDHKLGDTTIIHFLGRSVLLTNHNRIRRYYITRNRLFLYKMYHKQFPQFCRAELIKSIKDLLKIVLFENDKFPKIFAVLKGIFDFCHGKLGRY